MLDGCAGLGEVSQIRGRGVYDESMICFKKIESVHTSGYIVWMEERERERESIEIGRYIWINYDDLTGMSL